MYCRTILKKKINSQLQHSKLRYRLGWGREEREPKFRLARPFIPVLQPASRCYMRCCAFRRELMAIRWRHSAAEFLYLLPSWVEDKNGMRKFGSLSSLGWGHGLAGCPDQQLVVNFQTTSVIIGCYGLVTGVEFTSLKSPQYIRHFSLRGDDITDVRICWPS
jgi:hypothetical protein